MGGAVATRDLGSFVGRGGEGKGEWHAPQRASEGLRIGIGVGRVAAVDEERRHLAPLHLRNQPRQVGLPAQLLSGGAALIHRPSHVAQGRVERQGRGLRRDIGGVAHYETAPARSEQGLRRLLQGALGLRRQGGRRKARQRRDPQFLRDANQQRGEIGSLFGGGNRIAVIGVAAGEREPGLELEMLRHAPPRGVSPRGVLPGELHGRQPRPEEVGPKADDHVGLVKAIAREEGFPVQHVMGRAQRVVRKRVMDHMLAAGEGGEELPESGARGRADRAVGEHDHLTLARPRRGEARPHLRLHRPPINCGGLAVSVVEAEQGGLAGGAEAAARERVIRVALQLNGASVAHLGQRAASRTAAVTGGGIPLGYSRGQLRGRIQIGENPLHRSSAPRQSAGRERRAEDLQEGAPVEGRGAGRGGSLRRRDGDCGPLLSQLL